MADREFLEAEALEAICACRYYDLSDNLDITTDEDLEDIVKHKIPCEICGN